MDGTRDEAEALVSKCLVQDAGGGAYRVHDLVLDFLKISISVEALYPMRKQAAKLQAQYLGRLHVLKSYKSPEHGMGSQGLLFLAALWQSVEGLSGDADLETASYRASLDEVESCDITAATADYYSTVGDLLSIQVRLCSTLNDSVCIRR